MENNCKICDMIVNKTQNYGAIDLPILENKHFLSYVSVGSFIKGWTLIFTKEHKYNLSEEYEKEYFYTYFKKHIELIRNHFKGKVVIFEHGAKNCDSVIGCGVNHAHLHIVPFDKNLEQRFDNENGWLKCEFKEIKNITNGKEYLMFCDIMQKDKPLIAWVKMVDYPKSQYFRKLLAEEIKLSGEYDYKKDLRIEESLKTRNLFEV